MIRRVLIGLTFTTTLAFTTTLVFAQNRGLLYDYHPTINPVFLPVRGCAHTEPKENQSTFTCKNAKVTWNGSLDFTLSDPNRIVTLEIGPQAIPIKLETMPMYLDRVLEGDLNNDQKLDYAIKIGWGGNGIIGDANVTVFALSNTTGYKLTGIDTLTFDQYALVKQDDEARVLHVTLVSADGTDGRNHTYFVYTPLEIRGDSLVAGRTRTWIQYTFKPNHTPTKNLTVKEMARAWASEKRKIFVKLQ
jgi:hypothetical protein